MSYGAREPLPPLLKLPESKLESASTLIKRFSAGTAIRLVLAAMYWGTTYGTFTNYAKNNLTLAVNNAVTRIITI